MKKAKYIFFVLFFFASLVSAQPNPPEAYGWALVGGNHSQGDIVTTDGPWASIRGIEITIVKDDTGSFVENFVFRYQKNFAMPDIGGDVRLVIPYRAVIQPYYKIKLGFKHANGNDYWPSYSLQPTFNWDTITFAFFQDAAGTPPPSQNDSVYAQALLIKIDEININLTVGFQFDYITNNDDQIVYEWVGNDPDPILPVEPPPPSQPTEFTLYQNYPNPFNPSTTIKFALKEKADVVLKVYNILGQEVRTLVNVKQSAGYKTVLWDGRDNNGVPVATGVYIYRIQANDFVKNKKMVLLK